MIGSAQRLRWAPTLGAVPADEGASFRVWAPRAGRVEIVFSGETPPSTIALARGRDGLFSGWVADVSVGARYWLSVDGGRPLPDPASRWQPEGVHGPSAFVDPTEFVWTDGEWAGRTRHELVIYELHVGTFSDEGTFAGVESKLEYLASLGVTAIELMPIAEFAGSRNWGYDGVDLFAPSHHYGTPDDLRHLVNAAHMHGLAVILDVVYNHFGPDGAYMSVFSPDFFTDRYSTGWGAAVNLDGPGSEQVRGFFVENALHWIHEYHIDGLRLDATHALMDRGQRHFLADFTAEVRELAGRAVVIIAEDERNFATLVSDAPGGYALDAVWADDFHHQMRVALAGDREGYFADFSGSAADIAATIRRGWFYVGQVAPSTGRPRGSDPAGLDPSRFVVCLQNHDQVGNRAFGDRLHHRIDLAAYRAASALLLVVPQTPLLFMGQEWAVSTPFLYFTDHHVDLGRLVTDGRRAEFAAFAAFADPDTRAQIPDPQQVSTCTASRLLWHERESAPHSGIERLYRALLELRRGEAALCDPATPFDAWPIDGVTLAVQRGSWLLLVRLRDPGSVRLPAGDFNCVLTTEDAHFTEPGAHAPVIEVDRNDGVVHVHFYGPAAVLLKRER